MTAGIELLVATAVVAVIAALLVALRVAVAWWLTPRR